MQLNIPPYIYIMLTIFAVATAISVLIQAGIMLGLSLGLFKMWGKVEHILNHTTEHALPLIASTKVMLEELSPKLNKITDNLVNVSDLLKEESKTIKGSVDDVVEKTRAQTARVDEMVSGTLDGISHASSVIQHGIEAPLRQLNGIVNGFRAGFGVLRSKRRPDHEAEAYVYPPPPAREPKANVMEEELAGRPVR